MTDQNKNTTGDIDSETGPVSATTSGQAVRAGGFSPMAAGLVLVIAAAAFFGAYRFAQGRTGGVGVADATPSNLSSACGSGQCGSSGASGSSCCGSGAPTANGITGPESRWAATVEGGKQTIIVDLSKGYYDPNVIELKSGVPAEITFGQSSGCTSQVQSQELGFSEDLSAGPKTVKLPALQPGEYAFSCGMQMVYGKIVVK